MAWRSDFDSQEAKNPFCEQPQEEPLTCHNNDDQSGKQPGTILAVFQHELDKGIRGHDYLGELRTI